MREIYNGCMRIVSKSGDLFIRSFAILLYSQINHGVIIITVIVVVIMAGFIHGAAKFTVSITHLHTTRVYTVFQVCSYLQVQHWKRITKITVFDIGCLLLWPKQ